MVFCLITLTGKVILKQTLKAKLSAIMEPNIYFNISVTKNIYFVQFLTTSRLKSLLSFCQLSSFRP